MLLKAFGQILVTNSKRPNEGPLKLTFTNDRIYRDTLRQLEGLGYSCDAFWGYAVMNSPKDAIVSVETFLGSAS